MVGIFKQKYSGNALLLLLYALVLKFPLFLQPAGPLPATGDGYIYKVMLHLLAPVGANAPIVYPLLAFLLVFTQATLLNRIVNTLRLFPKPQFLVGMSYLLVTSLFTEWAYFSAPLLVNSLMIWIWYRMLGLYNSPDPKTSIYNVAVLVGLLPLLYSPATALVLLLAMALLITRPLRIAEWVVALLGLVTPYYFIFALLFLNDQWHVNRVIPSLRFHLPSWPASRWVIVSTVLLLLPLLPGGYFVQNNGNKTLIQVRKAWGLMLSFLIISFLLVLFVQCDNNYLHWILVAIPVATFHAAFYYYSTSKWFVLLFHYLTFGFAVMLSYGLLH